MIPELYRPTNDEIDAVISRGIEKHSRRPEVTRRMVRAADILRDWTLYAQVYPPQRHITWRVPSSRTPDERHYLITTPAYASYCTCPDYERGEWQRSSGSVPPHRARQIGDSRGAPRIGDQLWCKHRMAISAYVRILRVHLARGIDSGQLDVTQTPHRAEVLVLVDGLPLTYIPYTPGQPVRFATHYDAASFAAWLAGQPIPEPVPEAELPGPDTWPPQGHVEWQPELSPAQHRHWRETGEIVE